MHDWNSEGVRKFKAYKVRERAVSGHLLLPRYAINSSFTERKVYKNGPSGKGDIMALYRIIQSNEHLVTYSTYAYITFACPEFWSGGF